MVYCMEEAARRAVEAQLPEGHATVGFELNIRHLAPAEIGALCTARAQLEEVVDDRKLSFSVSVVSIADERLLGTGTHQRRVV